MHFNLQGWKRDWSLMSAFFNKKEIATITGRLDNLQIDTVVFCSFENRFARSGGLSAVTTNILPYLKEVNAIPSIILITPFYSEIIDQKALTPSSLSFTVPVNNTPVKVTMYEHTWNYEHPAGGSLKEYYLRADGYFDAKNKLNDPYSYDAVNHDRNAVLQSENALFFSRAVPLALKRLNIRDNIILHLHEWQTSLIALTAKEAMINGTLKSCGTVQTMHNSYDARIPRDMLSRFVDDSRKKSISRLPAEGLSAYRIGLQLVDAPITTVSENFARELTSDIIQTDHYAPHLQGIMKAGGVVGINNGMFSDFSTAFPKREHHTIAEVKKIKLKNRKSLLRILGTYKPPERFGDLTYRGRTISRLPDNVPIIAMSGRLDPIQKGYYVLLRAIETFDEDSIKVVLTPMTVNRSDLDYFYEVACKCRGNVTVFPGRMTQGYHELQTGATFGVMPSIYEPFGAAVEYMASGTVNIARATGGLVDQIDNSCGFLFREDGMYYTSENIRAFTDTGHIIQARKTNPWAQAMAYSLQETIRKAADLYKNDPEAYYLMILNGFRKAKQFHWDAAARKYYAIYTMAGNI